MPKEFSYRELKSATKCFNANRIIGHGAFGTVYKEILLENSDIVAMKRCSHSSQESIRHKGCAGALKKLCSPFLTLDLI